MFMIFYQKTVKFMALDKEFRPYGKADMVLE